MSKNGQSLVVLLGLTSGVVLGIGHSRWGLVLAAVTILAIPVLMWTGSHPRRTGSRLS